MQDTRLQTTPHELVEAEVIVRNRPKGRWTNEHSQKTKHSARGSQHAATVFIVSGMALLLSIVPVIGFASALFALIYAKIRRTNSLATVVALVISTVSTGLFMAVIGLFVLIL